MHELCHVERRILSVHRTDEKIDLQHTFLGDSSRLHFPLCCRSINAQIFDTRSKDARTSRHGIDEDLPLRIAT